MALAENSRLNRVRENHAFARPLERGRRRGASRSGPCTGAFSSCRSNLSVSLRSSDILSELSSRLNFFSRSLSALRRLVWNASRSCESPASQRRHLCALCLVQSANVEHVQLQTFLSLFCDFLSGASGARGRSLGRYRLGWAPPLRPAKPCRSGRPFPAGAPHLLLICS